MSLEIIPGYDRLEEIRELFSEYTDMLLELDPVFGAYLALQRYDEELQHPELKYALPYGRLLIARFDGALAGCIALRRLDERRCEMKRLYVRDSFRGRGIARALVSTLLSEASAQGYSLMLLDTLPALSSALSLYGSMGFVPVDKYNDSPLDYTIYLGRELK